MLLNFGHVEIALMAAGSQNFRFSVKNHKRYINFYQNKRIIHSFRSSGVGIYTLKSASRFYNRNYKVERSGVYIKVYRGIKQYVVFSDNKVVDHLPVSRSELRSLRAVRINYKKSRSLVPGLRKFINRLSHVNERGILKKSQYIKEKSGKITHKFTMVHVPRLKKRVSGLNSGRKMMQYTVSYRTKSGVEIAARSKFRYSDANHDDLNGMKDQAWQNFYMMLSAYNNNPERFVDKSRQRGSEGGDIQDGNDLFNTFTEYDYTRLEEGWVYYSKT